MKYAYENHLGGVYFTKVYEETRACSQCGDSDWAMGQFETLEDFIKSETDEDGFCPYELKYLEEQWRYGN